MPAREVLSFLPERFAFMRPLLREYDLRVTTAYCHCHVSEETVEQIIAWGRQHRDGRSIVRSVRIDAVYGPEDLDDLHVVEVFQEGDEDIADTDIGEVINYEEALEATFDCAWCDRVRVRQAADLEVVTVPRRDVLLTYNNEWVLSGRAREALRDLDLSYRPLVGTRDYMQLLVDQTADLCPEVPPAETYGEPCPGCGRRWVARVELVEGNPPDSPEIWVRRVAPVTITTARLDDLVLARSNMAFDRPTVHPRPVHRVGERVPPDDLYNLVFTGYRPFFARASLVRRLLENGIVGLVFRPVHVVPA